MRRLAGVAAGKEVVHSRAHCQLPGWKEQGGWSEESGLCGARRDDESQGSV